MRSHAGMLFCVVGMSSRSRRNDSNTSLPTLRSSTPWIKDGHRFTSTPRQRATTARIALSSSSSVTCLAACSSQSWARCSSTSRPARTLPNTSILEESRASPTRTIRSSVAFCGHCFNNSAQRSSSRVHGPTASRAQAAPHPTSGDTSGRPSAASRSTRLRAFFGTTSMDGSSSAASLSKTWASAPACAASSPRSSAATPARTAALRRRAASPAPRARRNHAPHATCSRDASCVVSRASASSPSSAGGAAVAPRARNPDASRRSSASVGARSRHAATTRCRASSNADERRP